MADQYFSAQPSSEDNRQVIEVDLQGVPTTVETSHGVFSAHRLDLGTRVLLKEVPGRAADEAEGHRVKNCLDLGCGWGPISLALAREYPQATVWALDVNERAVELTKANARRNHLASVQAGTTESLAADYGQAWEKARFDLIWSNPPIRAGKEELHALLSTYLTRLAEGGYAYLVVQKNLGADSLIPWLAQHLGDLFSVRKKASAKGYRVIEIHRSSKADVSGMTAGEPAKKAAGETVGKTAGGSAADEGSEGSREAKA